eukprot:15469148-Alexandrium_andersonii.AAC.1
MPGDARKAAHAARGDGCYFIRAEEWRLAFSSFAAWAPMTNGLNDNVFWCVAVVAVGRASGRLARMEADKQIYMRPG